MKKEDMRVAIAKDVLKRLKAKKLIAAHGIYASFEKPTKAGDLKSQLQELGSCQVCALGALFVSHVAMNNKYEVSRIDAERRGHDPARAADMRASLGEHFNSEQLMKIEAVFEGFSKVNYHPHLKDLSRSRDPDALDNDQRLVWICNEIIRQNGEFDLDEAEKQRKSEKYE